MDQRTFWKIIDEFVSEDKLEAEYFYAEFAERLAEMDAGELIEFASAMREALNTAVSWDMMGAAQLITGGVAEEGFEGFCGWLMAQGSDVFRQAVSHPDSLADYLRDYEGGDLFEDEDILGAPMSAFEEKTGGLEDFTLQVSRPLEPEGEQWDLEEPGEQAARLPQLYAYFMADDEQDDDAKEEGEDNYV
ncbi:MAG: hypothetical protein JWO08_1905 [Verrucomicrobiaceae bacterium]|nr:hypothetical protein [Verrucomicrobiaceae bacterium]